MLQQDQKRLPAKIANEPQSEITAKLSDPKMLGAFLNNANPYSAVVARLRYQIATKNQTHQRLEYSGGSHPSITVIKVLLDSGSDGDWMFNEKGTSMHFPYSDLTRQVPTSWHTSNGNFLTKGWSEVNLKFFEYSNSKEYLATPDDVE